MEGLAQSEIEAADDRALRRAGEAPRIVGNTVRLLRDGPAVFSAWLKDIAAAQRFILFENYIFHSDHTGEQLASALIARAEAGVQVYVLFDWFGCVGTSQALWRRMAHAGVKVRAFRPINLMDPLTADGAFPLIFLRNVMSYFDRPAQERVIASLTAMLEPGGYLFVGHSESLNGLAHGLEYVQVAVYRKPGDLKAGA